MINAHQSYHGILGHALKEASNCKMEFEDSKNS